MSRETGWHARRAHIKYLWSELNQRRRCILVRTGQPIGQSAEEWAELEEAFFRANVAFAEMSFPTRDANFWTACRGEFSTMES